jgi:hypothetical protein
MIYKDFTLMSVPFAPNPTMRRLVPHLTTNVSCEKHIHTLCVPIKENVLPRLIQIKPGEIKGRRVA